MTGPAELNITIYQGADFYLPFTCYEEDGVTPVPLSGATVRGMVRNDIDDAAPILTFVGAVTDGPGGSGTLTSPGATTAALVLPASAAKKRPLTKYIWDAEVVFADGYIQRLFEGFCFVSGEVTK